MNSRTGALALATVITVGACSPGADPPRGVTGGTSVSQAGEASRSVGISALENRFDPGLPDPLVDPSEIRSGGPPPDGIPPLDEPAFERADEVTWLARTEPVLTLTVGEETRGYPVRVMTWHEIVNDTVGGVPVAVTYCPLCNSGVAFLREVGGQVLSFGTSGMLYADNLVMYDRQTESLWPQLTGEAAVGVLTGEKLGRTALAAVAWSDFRAAHPRALVLSQETGFERPYGRNPYVGYDDPGGPLLFGLPDDPDPRLPVKERVVGIGEGDDAVAVQRSALVGRAPLEVRVGDRVVTVWHEPGQTSALDAASIPDGTGIGTVAVLDPLVGGRRLHFQRADGHIEDRETGSRWSILGRAVAGPLEGATLMPVVHVDTFWFAWVTFHPQTGLVPPRPVG